MDDEIEATDPATPGRPGESHASAAPEPDDLPPDDLPADEASDQSHGAEETAIEESPDAGREPDEASGAGQELDEASGAGQEDERASVPAPSTPRPEPPPPSGLPAVDAAVQQLGALEELPVEAHVEVFDDAQRRLHDALAELDDEQ